MASQLHKVSPLKPEKLCPMWPKDKIPWNDSREIPRGGRRKSLQSRAVEALDMALHIRNLGYNVYLSGAHDMGRTFMLCDYLLPIAKKEAAPPDILYVFNFDDEDKPTMLQLPAGQGKFLKKNLAKAIKDLSRSVPEHMESNAHVLKRTDFLREFQKKRSAIVEEMEKMAEAEGFSVEAEELGSLAIFPMADGKRLSEEELSHVDVSFRRDIKERGDRLLNSMATQIRSLSQLEKTYQQEEQDMARKVVEEEMEKYITPVFQKACKMAGCSEEDPLYTYFTNLQNDIPSHFELFLQHDQQAHSENALPEDLLYRYEINLLVDNSGLVGSPVIMETHPTYSRLIGCVERESEMGTLLTDFTLIKAGSLHKANGGYLILHANELLQYHGAWEALVRSLRSGLLSIEDLDVMDTVRVKSIEPEPMPLNVKVILIGDDDLYEAFLEEDEHFGKLFKIKAQMTSEVDKNVANVRTWLCHLAHIMDDSDLLPFSKDALAGLVDLSSFLCEDSKKISLRFPLLREIMIESSALASMSGLELVDLPTLKKAVAAKQHRSDLLETLYMEDYDRNLIKIRTDGSAVGVVNGLAVTTSGEYEFGLPHKIACTVGVGHGGIIDLEREAELGGPIHTKAMMILKSYLADQFAGNKPLVLSGSLCFEQSYTGIEGDSASGAELAALLSALSQVPIRLSLAITGAVSQSGQILAVGGVTKKIEGFFTLCKRRGLTGNQGVIIPADNVEHLMLNDEVINAVREGKFAVYPVTHITEALELLTGISTGIRHSDGSFTKNSLYDKVDLRLHEFGWYAEHSYKNRKRRSLKTAATVRKKKNDQ